MNSLGQESEVVLIVDDSPETLGMLNDALEQAGMTVLVALEGNQALRIARKIRPDIILLDAIMPHLDGFETCILLKADPRLADIPVIFMTGLSDTESIVKGLEAGGVDYLTKPIKPDELMARMRVHLNNARLRSSAHDALDTTGQHFFMVNIGGQVIWATPETKNLFSQAKLSEHWLQEVLPGRLRDWFEHVPTSNQMFKLSDLEQPVSIQLVGDLGDQDILLKLVVDTEAGGSKQLKEKLPLTNRQSEVLYWISIGKANREIGQILSTSPRTVNKHLEEIYRKLEVDNRTAAAAIAIHVLSGN